MVELSLSEKRAISVLAFLMFRMRRNPSAERYYRALAKFCNTGSREYRQAMAGLAAVSIDSGAADQARLALREAMSAGALSSQDSALYLMNAQALLMQGRREEAEAALEEYHFLNGTK